MIGGAEDDRLHRTNSGQIEYRARAREQEERRSLGATVAQIGNQRLLCGLIQPLLNDINNLGH